MKLKLGFTLCAAFTLFTLFPNPSFSGQQLSDLRTAVPELLVGEQIWGLNLGFGVDYFNGNQNEVNAAANLALFKRWETVIGYLTGGYKYSGIGEPLVRNVNTGSVTLRGDYIFSPMWRWFAFTTHNFNEFQGVLYRGSIGTGPWYQITTPTIWNGFSVAAVYEFENQNTGNIERIGRLSIRNVFSIKLSPTAVFNLDFFYVPAFADFSDARFIFNPSLDMSLSENRLVFRVYANFERDTRPVAGLRNNDLELGSALTLKFGE